MCHAKIGEMDNRIADGPPPPDLPAEGTGRAASPLLAVSVTGGPVAFTWTVERSAAGALILAAAFVVVALVLALIARAAGRALTRAAAVAVCPLPTFA